MNRIPEGKEIRLPNGDWGIVQGYEEGRYLVIDGYGVGKAKWLAPEELAPEVAMQELGETKAPRLPGF